MKKLFLALVLLLAATCGIIACSNNVAQASSNGPLLNVYDDANFLGSHTAQWRATGCGTVGASSRQEFQISWPGRTQASSYFVSMVPTGSNAYCNVIGVHAYGPYSGGWYQVCANSSRYYWGGYGIGSFGSSPYNWFNDNVDYVMIGYYSGCPLAN